MFAIPELDKKFDNLVLVKRALEIWRAQGGSYTQAFQAAEAEQRQPGTAQRPATSSGLAMSEKKREVESITINNCTVRLL
jgi:hypothetical protein